MSILSVDNASIDMCRKWLLDPQISHPSKVFILQCLFSMIDIITSVMKFAANGIYEYFHQE